MRRIAFFSLTPSPPAPPANQKVLQALQTAFPQHTIDVFHVLEHLKRARGAMAVAAIVAGATYAPDLLRRQKALKYAAIRTPWLFRWIKRWAADKVDSCRYDFSFQMQSLFDASVPGVPHFVYTDHTHLENLNYEGFDPANLYSANWIDCERTVYRNAAMVFTRSSNVSASLVSQYFCDPGQLACVYAGSNAEVPDKVQRDPGRYARKNILFAGVDWQRKGGPTLLAAFARVLMRHPDASLTIVGCSPDVGDMPRCRVVGRVPLDQMPRHFAAASIFCLPTQIEPFGIVFVEAMWQQLPVVATNVGAVPDMVENGANGYLVAPGDAKQLADRLNELLDDPIRCASFGAASLDLARDRYDWTAVARRMKCRIEAVLEP